MDIFDDNGNLTKVFELQLKDYMKDVPLSDQQVDRIILGVHETVKVIIDSEIDPIWKAIRKIKAKIDADVNIELGREMSNKKLATTVGLICAVIGSLIALAVYLKPDPNEERMNKIELLIQRLAK